MPPLLLLAAATLGGALLALAWPLPVASALAALGGLSTLAVLRPRRALPILAAAALAGALASSLRAPAEPELPADRSIPVVARVATPPLPLGAGCRVAVTEVAARPARAWTWRPGVTHLRITGPCPALRPGERLRFRAAGPDPRPGGLAQTALHVRAHGIARVGSGPAPFALLARLRHRGLAWIAPWRDPGRAALAAVVLGDRAWLDVADRAALRRTGTAHLLAISGLHVGLVAGLLFGIGRRLPRLHPPLFARVAAPRLAAGFALGGTWAFVLLAGAAPSAVRAGLMVTAWLLGHLTGRRVDPLASFGLAVIGVTLWEPVHWATPGCQLSFAAVLGLLLAGRPAPGGGREGLAPHAEPVLLAFAPDGAAGEPPRPFHRLRELLRATAVATLATMPLGAYHFGEITFAGLLANLLAVPVMCSAVVPLGLVGLGLALAHPALGDPALALAAGLADGTLGATDLLATSLGAPLTAALRPAPAEVVAAYGLLGALLIALRARRARALALGLALASAALAASSLGLGALGPGGGAALRVELLAVGDGDAILVTLPDGRHGLVDAPGSGDPTGFAERRLVRALAGRGVRRLAFVVATHGHADHIGGLPAVLEAFPVDVLWHRGFAVRGPEWAALRAAARRQGVPLAPFRDQALAGVRLEALGVARSRPARPADADPALGENDRSLVLRLVLPAGAVLLAADVERAGEAHLLRRPRALRAAVLKVAHHGARSATSDALLDAVRPAVALIPARAPRASRPGRPSPVPALARRLRARGVAPFVTGIDGDLRVELAPWGLTVTARGRTVLRLPPDHAPFAPPGPGRGLPLAHLHGLGAPAAP